MDRAAGRLVCWLVGAAALALAVYTGARWRDLRDGWRVARVRSHPGYAELRARWQRIAIACDTLHWPEEPGAQRQQKLQERQKVRSQWTGPAEFFSDLKRLTDDAERQARADFGGACISEKICCTGHDDRAAGALVAMRTRGEVSAGTFARAMLVLARHREHCFLNELGPDALRVGLVVLCDLVGDGERPQAHPPPRSLDEAIEEAARTRTATALCARWKRLAARREPGLADMQLELQCKPSPPGYELEAYRALARLTETSRGCPRREELPDPGWPRGPETAEEVLPETSRSGRYETGRKEVLAAVRAEGERLPPELRGRYLAVLREVFRNGLDRTVAYELASSRDAAPEPASNTLRLVAAIVRNWG